MRRVNEFSTTSSWTGNPTGYRSGNTSLSSGDGQLGWDYHTGFQNTRSGTLTATDYRAFEERLPLRPSRVTSSIPMDHYSQPTRIIIFNHHLDRGMNPTFPPILHRPVSQRNRYVPSNATDESKLSAEEQETVLKNLHRQTYKHVPKKSRRVSLYYRDLNRDPTSKPSGKNTDEDGKICAVCLEDFEHGEEVMLTCCKHMFHEECIVPWVKNQGKCPVCRSALYDSIRENEPVLNRNRTVPPADDGRLFSDDIVSLIRAVDEAFLLGD